MELAPRPHNPRVPTEPVPHFQSFRVSRKLTNRGVLKAISADALRLFCYLSMRFHGGRTREVMISDLSLELGIGLNQMQVDEARYQLSVLGVITYVLGAVGEPVKYIHTPD
jgi:hypothetical protein